MTLTEIQTQINALRDELETRHKYGVVKLADDKGVPIPVEAIQKELFSLIYKKSKLLNLDE